MACTSVSSTGLSATCKKCNYVVDTSSQMLLGCSVYQTAVRMNHHIDTILLSGTIREKQRAICTMM